MGIFLGKVFIEGEGGEVGFGPDGSRRSKLSPSLRPLSSPHRMLLIEFQSQPPSASSSSKVSCTSSTLKLAPMISSTNSVANFDQSSTWPATASSTGNVIRLYSSPAQRPTQGLGHCTAHCIFSRYQCMCLVSHPTKSIFWA